ncbi:MAG TPA: transaldolase [Burkholderiales bacterium]|nr:transaldolase [Burkholderiales bacterium]
MKATQKLHDLGQSLWLDNITRDLLTTGTLKRYIDELSVTGLTSNPTIFDHAIKNSAAYDPAIRKKLTEGKTGEALFFELALEDITQAADLFRPVFDRTCGVDGFVSLEVSPLLAYDTKTTITVAKQLHARAGRPNLFIKIPGTPQGLPAIEEAIFAGVPINVTLLFSREHYVAAADAYWRGIERRIAAGLRPDIASVASLFISRWDVAVANKAPKELTNRLGIAIAQRAYKAYRDLLAAPRSQRAFNNGARPQRLLLASTGTKDPKASDILYVQGLAAPHTVNTMPESTLKAFADHGELGAVMSPDGGDCEAVLGQFAKAGVDVNALAAQLQDEGAKAFVNSWNELMAVIASKSAALEKTS